MLLLLQERDSIFPKSRMEQEACIGRFHDCDDVCCHVGDVDDFAAAAGKDADRHRNARLAVELRDDHQIEDASLMKLPLEIQEKEAKS